MNYDIYIDGFIGQSDFFGEGFSAKTLREKLALAPAGVDELTSSKEKATMFFGCLVGFVSGSVPGLSLGALGYTLVFGAGFALATTPIGWLIGGGVLCGIIGAIAVYTFNYFSRKHDDKAHKAIYNPKDLTNQQLLMLAQSNEVHQKNQVTQQHHQAQQLHALGKIIQIQDKKIDQLTVLVNKQLGTSANHSLSQNSDSNMVNSTNPGYPRLFTPPLPEQGLSASCLDDMMRQQQK